MRSMLREAGKELTELDLHYQMTDILPLLSIPQPGYGKTSYNIPCPICDKAGTRDKHLNINLKKNVFCCPKCGNFSGGVFDLYAYYENVPRDKVFKTLRDRLGGQDAGLYGGKGHKRKRRLPPPPPLPEEVLADVDTRDRVYRALLDRLSLAPDHRENLLGRGLNDEAIVRLQYRTTPTADFCALAQELIDEGHDLHGVPGFYRDKDGRWTLALYRRGIMIPCRDRLGRIQSIHIRLDEKMKKGGKFLTFSSTDKLDGTKAENWCHLTGSVQNMILLIEGYMKADIVHHFTGLTVLAIPGVTSLQHLETTLKELTGLGVKHVMTCFDMDYLKNWHVEGSYTRLVELLGGLDLTFGTYLWVPECNGLDDYLLEYYIKKKAP